MANRKRRDEILELKKRNPYLHTPFSSFALESLRSQWNKVKEKEPTFPDFFLVRAVTLLEVSVRGSVAELVDRGQPYTGRATGLTKDLKFDYEVASDLQGKTITLGDLIAHSISLNRVEQFILPFTLLLDRQPQEILGSAIERIPGSKQGIRIVEDYDRLIENLDKLLRIRHIVVHEAPKRDVYSESDVSIFLNTASQFCRATEVAVLTEFYGEYPITQQEMNVSAYKSKKRAEEKLNATIELVRSNAEKRGAILAKIYESNDKVPARFKQSAEEWLRLLDESQSAWLAYREKQAEFANYTWRTGSVYPTRLYSTEASITEKRTEELERWLELDRVLNEP